MTLTIERIEILLLIAAVVAMLARRLRVPYSVGLVVAGIGLAMIRFAPDIQLTKELIFTALLPPLIFEAAFYLHWRDLRKDLAVVLTLATVGVLLSATATALGMRYLAQWEWTGAAVFGVLISATDPVSVIATFKEAGAKGRIRLLVEAESLFNDCTAAVAFTIALVLASGQTVGVGAGAKTLAITIVGAVLSGAVVAGVALLLAGATDDHLVEITFTTIAAYGSFLVAERFHFSGVLATVTAGLIIGNVGHLGISSKSREAVEGFWEYAAFVANSLIFLLIGMRVAHQSFTSVLIPSAIAIALVTLSRALAIYPCSLLFARSALKIKARHQHILFWGGLRGALALALALGLPAGIPQREEIISVAFAVVAFSILIQGLTIKPLLRRMGELSTKVQVNTK
ncbi:MAG: nhaP [Acidobacteria bacterium]|nr:nhaP [Acidobacteriota bacterium]